MIRWSYLVPRLILLAAVAVAVWLGLDPLLRWTTVQTVQTVSRAKVDLGRVTTHLATAEVTLHEVQVANAGDPMRNLFEAQDVTLGFEVFPLLKRRFVVREGRISGLRLGTARSTSGAMEFGRLLDLLPDDLAIRLDPAPLVGLGQAWFERFAMLVKREITEEVEQLQSVRLAKELSQRWPAELERMEARAEQMKARADRLRELAKGASADPLQNLGRAQQMVAEGESLNREVAEFRSEVQRLHDQAFRDRDRIVAARDEDLRKIREQLRLDDLESGGLSEFLLGHELNQRVQTAAQWVHWIRKHIPGKSRDSDDSKSGGPTRARGVDMVFAGLSPQPDFVIRSLRLEGEGQSGGKRFEFVGEAKGITTQPALYGQPAVFHVEIRGPVAMQIEAIADRTQPVARDYLTVSCPALAQPKRVLGKAGQMAVAVSPGTARLSLRMELVGDSLSGRLSLRQEQVELEPQLSASYGGDAMARRLREALGKVNTLDATVALSGTLDKPEAKVRSSLGGQLAQAFQSILLKEIESRRDELARVVQTRVDGEVARFEQAFHTRQQALLAKLQQNGVDVQQLRDLATRQMPGLDRLLDNKLDLGRIKFK